MTTDNPFRTLVEEANARILLKDEEVDTLTGDAQKAAYSEVQRLSELAQQLNQASLKWRMKRLAEAIAELEAIVRSETARQSDIYGRLKTVLVRLGGNPGDDTTAPKKPQTAPPSAGAGGSVDVTIPTTQIDPRKRHTSLELLHPDFRKKVEALIADLAANKVPMKIFESYRTPERQAYLFAQGRTRDLDKGTVTGADAWHSRHQYGVAVDMVIDHPKHGMWETGNGTVDGWWNKYHELAAKNGLERLSFELPHVQLTGFKTSRLLSGEQPGPGDDSWSDNFTQAVARWPGGEKPPLPEGVERPTKSEMALASGHAVSGIDWSALAAVRPVDWMSKFGGREWRVDGNGIYLRDKPNTPQRTPGAPTTVMAALDVYADHIGAACQKFDVPPEMVLMTIATETAAMRKNDFTGITTFRWEQGVRLTTTGDPALDNIEMGDYSAGPMQVLSNTAREVNNKLGLGFDNATDLKWFKNKPGAAGQKDLGMYRGEVAISIGTGYIGMRRGLTDMNPVLVSAAYNSGGVRASGTNLWRIRFFGDHLDRAVNWFGDACEALKSFGR